MLKYVLVDRRHGSRYSIMAAIYQCLKDLPIKNYRKYFTTLDKDLNNDNALDTLCEGKTLKT